MGTARARDPLKLPSARTARSIAEALGAWYAKHRRDLPWRRHRDPYAIWVSEVMLQQTQVATVRPYFERWMARFPTLTDLAKADERAVLHAWQGLGYYSRAKNLRRGARAVVREHGGTLPRSTAALRTLPGIGPYTAGAIASIAYGERTPIVDGNVVRVLCRLFGLRGDPARAPLKQHLWRLAAELIPAKNAASFNQALMELGATVCRPKKPLCARCPLRRRCVARRDGTVGELPDLAKRRPSVAVHRAAAVVERQGRLLLVRIPNEAARWAGLWQFPSTDLRAGEAPARAAGRAVRDAVGLEAQSTALALTVRHSVTHHRITLDVYHCSAATGPLRCIRCSEARWTRLGELEQFALPAAHRRIARHLQSIDR